jgi:hypothetical protein
MILSLTYLPVSDILIRKQNTITFLDRRIPYHYTEEVAALRYDKIMEMLTTAGFQLVDCFGNYDLQPFDKKESKRLILILKK